mmetsp:Transcript_2591/g.6882  ORF Transcript_2591/g.6882 Transcript_2591/m.6882 type:complete len:93 (-) Transcript_2591:454-732(-)
MPGHRTERKTEEKNRIFLFMESREELGKTPWKCRAPLEAERPQRQSAPLVRILGVLLGNSVEHEPRTEKDLVPRRRNRSVIRASVAMIAPTR